jgi:hypothetical protein
MTTNVMKYPSFDDLNQDVSFDDAATSAMGEAFDRTCRSLPQFGASVTARETIARWFIEAAINGERDFSRLYEQAHEAFGVTDFSMPLVSVGRDPPVQAYASVAHAA